MFSPRVREQWTGAICPGVQPRLVSKWIYHSANISRRRDHCRNMLPKVRDLPVLHVSFAFAKRRSGYSYYSTYSTIANFPESGSMLFAGCVSTYAGNGATTVSARSADSALNMTAVSGAITMWAQPITVEYQQSDASLFITSTSLSTSTPASPKSTASAQQSTTGSSASRSSATATVSSCTSSANSTPNSAAPTLFSRALHPSTNPFHNTPPMLPLQHPSHRPC